MKFCRDIFRAVFKVDKDIAVKAFEKEKMSFHPIARKMIEKVGACGAAFVLRLLMGLLGPWSCLRSMWSGYIMYNEYDKLKLDRCFY